MAGKGKATRSGKGTKKITSTTKKAGLIFPPSRCTRKLRVGRYSIRTGPAAGAFMAATLEYLTCEILELAGNAALEAKKKTITPRHLQLALGTDDELNKLMCSTTISAGGVLPNVQEALWPKKGSKAAGTQEM
jgi:histone H2A